MTRMDSSTSALPTEKNVVLVGGGIMSATLGTFLQQLEPTWHITLLERLDGLAEESSGPWNNAGTGHSALCELNYTPQKADGTVEISKAVAVNEQFQLSRQLWSYLVESGAIPEPAAFIRTTPHMSFVWGDANVAFLKARYEAIKDHPLFAGMQYSEDPEVIKAWAPLLINGRKPGEKLAATFHEAGTDVDFGTLTKLLTENLVAQGATVRLGADVKRIQQTNDGTWHVMGKDRHTKEKFHYTADFLFVGAGGRALPLLQKANVEEIRGFGGFPVSGEFLRTSKPELVDQHLAKVYGQAAVGAPPMSVPHLDTRVIDGRRHLLFGPYAGWTPKFLKKGSFLDFFGSINGGNLGPMLKVARHNIPLTKYLVTEVFKSKSKKFSSIHEYFPAAQAGDWEKITAGQRVQVIRPDGTLQFGTEVITGRKGTVAGLLGASPGASTATPIMLEVLHKCFPAEFAGWAPKLAELVPTYGTKLGDNPALAVETLTRTAKVLQIN